MVVDVGDHVDVGLRIVMAPLRIGNEAGGLADGFLQLRDLAAAGVFLAGKDVDLLLKRVGGGTLGGVGLIGLLLGRLNLGLLGVYRRLGVGHLLLKVGQRILALRDLGQRLLKLLLNFGARVVVGIDDVLLQLLDLGLGACYIVIGLALAPLGFIECV